MKRLFVSLCLTLTLMVSPALAAGIAFTDVPAGSWYEQGVRLCAERGVMIGTGDGRFSPGDTLSAEESIVLALRLHSLMNGGDGSFEHAPEDWGLLTMTFPDGRQRSGYRDDETVWHWGRLSRVDDGHLGFLPEQVAEADRDWFLSLDYQPVTLTCCGQDFTGTLHFSSTAKLYVYFEPDAPEAWSSATQELLWPVLVPGPQTWYRDAWYYAEENGLEERTLLGWSNDDRAAFAERIAGVTGLPALRSVDTIPDVERASYPTIYHLYEAGILNGVDAAGTFQPYTTLTRAEAAVIVARVLDEDLRFTAPLSPPPSTEP